jgi:phosphatidylserine/phosphatidylglycerophosphate/cardiolipin synthase-like enzyme
MVNDQLLGEELADHKPPRKTSPRPRREYDDEAWKPEDEDLEDEELEDEYVDSVDVKPSTGKAAAKKPMATKTTTAKPTTPRASKKRPAASPAASPDKHKVVASGPRPTWRLTPASNKKPPEFLVQGQNADAPFTFTAYRGEGMCMLAMNWKNGTPPDDFVGFAIEYQEPQSTQWRPIPNYLTFPGEAAREGPDAFSSRLSPHQRFRWVHFPYSVDTPGKFHYRVTPVFMKGDEDDHTLTYGEVQKVAIELMAETYPGKMNVAFTRGFVSSKAFLKKFGSDGGGDLLPAKADLGLEFKPKSAENEEKALSWLGFEAREVILGALDAAIKDPTAQVRVLAYDFNEPQILSRLQKIGKRLKIIIDNSSSHDKDEDAESKAAEMLSKTAGKENVQRQHMGSLQHNKIIVVDGAETEIAIGGSTNFSWRGLYVQNNNLVALQGPQPVKIFNEAFDNYWNHPNDTDGFYKTGSSQWMDLGLGIDAQVTFSPHSSKEGALDTIAADIKACESSLFYSLAFLYETPGVIRDAIEKKMGQKGVMVYGLSDKSVGGLDARKNGNPPVAYPEDFDEESAGGSGARMHHKFVVIDFNKPTARVYTGSHNFSVAADTKNAENLFLIRDQRVATAYMIEAVAMFDHYEVRDHVAKKKDAEKKGEKHTIHLRLPPSKSGEKPWWDQYWSVKQKSNDREMFGV